VQCNLEPRRPQDTEEADVAEQVVAVGDGMVCGEGREIGHEEEIKEELDAVGFVTLREDEGIVIGADQRGLDPRCGLVQPPQVLLLVAVRLSACMSMARPKLDSRTHLSAQC
jgi:hypothetical protein